MIKKDEKKESVYHVAVGRRKTATALVRLYPQETLEIAGIAINKGDIIVNGLPAEKYFSGNLAKQYYSEIYRTTNSINRFITVATVSGSGKTGQLGAFGLALSRALVKVDEKFRPMLRKKGYLTRDPRMKEREKPGLMGVRKEKQSPKR